MTFSKADFESTMENHFLSGGTAFTHLPSFLSIEDTDDDSKMADLLSCFQQQLTFPESVLKLCQPELESSQTHISGVTSWSL